jgi:hypothetical protein
MVLIWGTNLCYSDTLIFKMFNADLLKKLNINVLVSVTNSKAMPNNLNFSFIHFISGELTASYFFCHLFLISLPYSYTNEDN